MYASDKRKNIVIVGGGGGGVAVARRLSEQLQSSQYRIVLINPRSYFIILPATVRLAVYDTDRLEERVFVPLDRVFHNGNGVFIRGKVKAIDKNKGEGGTVLLEGGDRVDFEVLVLSPGFLWDGPIAFPEDESLIKEFIAKWRESFKKAYSIVLAGGGATGIELAGEIKDVWPDKKVTIVHGGCGLMNSSYPMKVRKRLESRIQQRGVDVILNDYIDNPMISSMSTVKTRNGMELDADLVVSTRGPRPNSEFIASSLGAHTVTDHGLVKVLPTLQLPEHPDIFAIGDVIDWPEQKQLIKAQNHAEIVSSNVLRHLSGEELESYKGSCEIILVTVGKTGGVCYFGFLWGIVFGDWVSRLTKSSHLLVDRIRASVGY
ncbi:hypothetical protein AMATHDRAFT_69216 [Amanita thiersii Skay4041]|uniref:FAD/NAD(P)-binding domain-containing protein n=1 Tax=Amanita thiersii Skay4041 TaxID=703135 RepID=A0A2A9N9N2_9AGAR|nr:hypothetical protein AMATHDRAFT_69216 [Amanita thiersii Skay4041]